MCASLATSHSLQPQCKSHACRETRQEIKRAVTGFLDVFFSVHNARSSHHLTSTAAAMSGFLSSQGRKLPNTCNRKSDLATKLHVLGMSLTHFSTISHCHSHTQQTPNISCMIHVSKPRLCYIVTHHMYKCTSCRPNIIVTFVGTPNLQNDLYL